MQRPWGGEGQGLGPGEEDQVENGSRQVIGMEGTCRRPQKSTFDSE